MSLDDLSRRVTYVLGIGVLGLGACTKAKEPEVREEPTAVPSVSVPITNASDTAATPPTAVVPPSATTTAGPGLGISGPPVGLSGHGCGSRLVCKPAAAKAPAAHAPAPFDRCAASLPADDEASHGPGTFDLGGSKDASSKTPTCCYRAPVSRCGGGRPLVTEEGARLATIVSRDDYRDASVDLSAPAPRDLSIAAGYLRDAACEHASVASFARISLVLLSLGAPPSLLAEVHAAALDEIRHAQIFCSLAERRGAPAMGPGPLSLTGVDLDLSVASFVHETLRDGCIAEARALLDLEARAAEGDPVERMHFARIVADEGRHVELSWKMLAWVVDAHGDVARAALEDALRSAARDDDPLVATLVRPCAEALVRRAHGRAVDSTAMLA